MWRVIINPLIVLLRSKRTQFDLGWKETQNEKKVRTSVRIILSTESLILAQNERWRHGLGMQVER